ncbi:DNA-directed DNA polymerase [Zostera marina]|uniref:DNA-directed DNA polymerase n=1 Tax=Zostera marina TaxID=29655 RepID=A0A0K9Q1R7_ZOSMR|nr:DNA-directed DNA polymerase [Zostera marina]
MIRLILYVQEAKSIGAEVNWGVRFRNTNDCEIFLMNLCKEVSSRLHECGMQGRTLTLKVSPFCLMRSMKIFTSRCSLFGNRENSFKTENEWRACQFFLTQDFF